MSSAPFPKPIHFIDRPNVLQDCLESLAACPAIAFDLEFDSHRHAYGFTLALVQVATPDSCYVIDPFAVTDLSGLFRLFEDAAILKIVHAAGEDIRLLHSLECYPKNLYDTEIPAKLLNYDPTSLATLLQDKLGHTISKQQQKSNWLRRPLSPEQVRYAADDVAWLHELRAILVGETEAAGLTHYVKGGQEAIGIPVYKPETKENFLKPADMHQLSPRDQHILNALYKYRDELARQLNKPAYQVLDEPVVRELATGTLQPAALPDAKGVYKAFKNRAFSDELTGRLAAIRDEAASLELSEKLPPRQRLTWAEQAARAAANRDRDARFAPVQEALAARFGVHAARYLFSNSTVNDLILHTLKLGDLKPYRQELIRGTAAELGIDLSAYE